MDKRKLLQVPIRLDKPLAARYLKLSELIGVPATVLMQVVLGMEVIKMRISDEHQAMRQLLREAQTLLIRNKPPVKRREALIQEIEKLLGALVK
jgi:hypothetical protein